MSDELKTLRKDASKKKRLASDIASKIHDLVEDTYWTEYDQLPALAQEAIAACEAWAEAQKLFDEASAEAHFSTIASCLRAVKP